jgi:hypothetical protein
VVEAFHEACVALGPLTSKEAFRAAATRAREGTGIKGKALFHPIRVALTGLDSGPELDLAVPAIEELSVLLGTPSCTDRLAALRHPGTSAPRNPGTSEPR